MWVTQMAAFIGSVILAAVIQAPRDGVGPERSDASKAVQGYTLYSTAAKVDPGYADDLIDNGIDLLYYRAMHFACEYGKYTPETAMRAAVNSTQVPDVKRLGETLNAGPIETEVRPNPDPSDDRKWVIQRSSELARRNDLGPVLPLLQDQSLPLKGRVRVRVVSEQERETQISDRIALLLVTLEMCRDNGGASWKPSDQDVSAARTVAQEQFDRDYMNSDGRWISMRGRTAKSSRSSINDVAGVIIGWVGGALRDIEGVKHMAVAPANGEWVVVDADTGWSIRDPVIGRFSERDILLIHRGFKAGLAESGRNKDLSAPVGP